MLADALDGSGWEGAAGIQCAEGRVLLHVRQCTGVPMTNSYVAPDVCGAEVAKPCSKLQYLGGSEDKKQGPWCCRPRGVRETERMSSVRCWR